MLLVQAQVDKHILTRVYENVQSGVKRVCILASRWKVHAAFWIMVWINLILSIGYTLLSQHNIWKRNVMRMCTLKIK